MPKIIVSKASIVVKGTAPEDFFPQMKKLRKKLIENKTNG